MEKINIAELLKDCPKGMELYSPIYGNGVLTKITNRIHVKFPKEHNVKCFRFDGKISEDGEVMLFPKGKTTWKGFQRPFKDGDIVYAIDEGNEYIFILKHIFEHGKVYCYLSLKGNDLRTQEVWLTDYNPTHRLATEEEKQKLFKVIKDNGYNWNPETKTLEKLIIPKFKVGDRIRLKNDNDNLFYKIINIKNDCYITDQGELQFRYEYLWELVPNKFDINTLVPFESRVLVRNDESQYWIPAFWGCKRDDGYTTTFGWSKYCVPYEGNEHLLEKSDDCDEYFKTWK